MILRAFRVRGVQYVSHGLTLVERKVFKVNFAMRHSCGHSVSAESLRQYSCMWTHLYGALPIIRYIHATPNVGTKAKRRQYNLIVQDTVRVTSQHSEYILIWQGHGSRDCARMQFASGNSGVRSWCAPFPPERFANASAHEEHLRSTHL